MRGRTGRDWRDGKHRYIVHLSTGSAAMRWYDESLDVGVVIESGTYEVWRVERPRQAEGSGMPGRS
jgi:hypothetical protein